MLSARKKLDIFIEAHALDQLESALARAGFKGWSVFSGIEGAGAHGAWRQSGVAESEARLVVAIGTQEAADHALAWLAGYFADYPGIVAVSDVSVMRSERF
ncbi:MAG: DUF190 domain-containing protein [Gammaproteobacteria bacterium]